MILRRRHLHSVGMHRSVENTMPRNSSPERKRRVITPVDRPSALRPPRNALGAAIGRIPTECE